MQINSEVIDRVYNFCANNLAADGIAWLDTMDIVDGTGIPETQVQHVMNQLALTRGCCVIDTPIWTRKHIIGSTKKKRVIRTFLYQFCPTLGLPTCRYGGNGKFYRIPLQMPHAERIVTSTNTGLKVALPLYERVPATFVAVA